MLIIWGRKVVEQHLGRVADYCKLCREVRAFTMTRVGVASHLYYVSLGPGELRGHRLACEACGAEYGGDPSHYLAMVRDRKLPLADLVRATNPRCAAVKPRALSPEERWEVIVGTFVANSEGIERRFAAVDPQTGLGLAGIAAGLAFWLVQPFAGIPIAVLALIYLVAALLTRGDRALRDLLPRLAVPLTPLCPTQDELRATLDYLQYVKVPAARRLQPDVIYNALTRHKPRPLILGL